MPGGQVCTGKQQLIAVIGRAVQVVLEKAEAKLLVVGIVPLFHSTQGQRLHQRLTVVPPLEVGLSPGDTLRRFQSRQRFVQPLQDGIGRE